jgi:hypothetical protein
MRESKSVLLLYAISVATIAFIGMALLQVNTLADTDYNVSINVSIQSVGQITLNPDSIAFSQDPSSESTDTTLDIKNTGSINISQINVFVDTLYDEAARPYGNPNASFYAAGGVVVIHNSTDSASTYYFAGRLEWNSTGDVSNKVLTGITTPVAWGFFKNASREYFWGLGNGSTGLCNDTGAEFGINDGNDNGTAASRTTDTTSISLTPAINWGLFSDSRATSPLYNSCVAAYYDCKKIYIYKYDMRSNPNFQACTNAKYLQASNLVPGDYHRMTLNIFTPHGIPAGVMNISTLTIYATSA